MSVRRKKNPQTYAEILEQIDELAPPREEVQENRKFMRRQTQNAAVDQIVRAMPEQSDSSDPLANHVDAGFFISTFLPSDGAESALSRLMVASTNAAMDCYARANSEDAPVRDLELNYAAKLALVTAALSKALDHHRSSVKEDYIDDTLPIPEDQKDLATRLSEKLRAKTNTLHE